MPSLTPTYRSQEATEAATRDGLISGALMLGPSSLAVYAAMKNVTFLKSTNWQSRTALAIMPALFVYAYSSEQKLNHKMHEMANEADHSREVSEWAEKIKKDDIKVLSQSVQKPERYNIEVSGEKNKSSGEDVEKQLLALYAKSVEESGVRIVPGNSLGIYHQAANFWQENPFKILAAVGVPTVLYIFNGNNKKGHLQLQSKLMHTRVYGQFAVISMLLTLMGFKSYMDSQGKFITEMEAQMRVNEMKRMREELTQRIEMDKKIKEHRDKLLRNVRQQSEEKRSKKQQQESEKKLRDAAVIESP